MLERADNSQYRAPKQASAFKDAQAGFRSRSSGIIDGSLDEAGGDGKRTTATTGTGWHGGGDRSPQISRPGTAS